LDSSSELVSLREKTARLLEQAVRGFAVVGEHFEIPYQSTRVIVHPIDWTSGRTLLRIIAPILVDVEPVPALHVRLGELNNTTVFGKFYVRDRTIFIEHNLLGESVDEAGFRAALASVAHHADHLDEPLQAEFGGQKWGGRA